MKHQYQNMTLDDLKKLLGSSDISKNQKKKILKQIKWIENVEERRHNRKEKKKAKALKRKNEFEGGETQVQSQALNKKPRKEKISTNSDFEKHVHVAVDLSFSEYMTNLDISKLRKQIAWCYKENRRSTHPVQYHICGLDERTKRGMDQSYVNWDVHFDDEIHRRFRKDDMIYLTSDSSEVLADIRPGKVYIIGGLVDHNKHKGLTQKLATEKGLQTARLPMEDHVDMKTRKVLTVNHVFDIIVAYCEVKDWKAAFIRAIPYRKGAIPIPTTSTKAAE